MIEANPHRGPGRVSELVSCLRADLEAMCEGRRVGPVQVAARLLVHARWRTVVLWRIAQFLVRRTATKPLALILTDLILAISAGELQPTARIGPGLVLKHTTGLVVGGEVVAGERLTLHQNVTLGDRRPYGGQPVLGDDVMIGAGACVLGPIRIGSKAVIAANAVVLDDVAENAVVSGNPAEVIDVRNGRRES